MTEDKNYKNDISRKALLNMADDLAKEKRDWQTEKQLREQEIERQKNSFISIASHQLRTPLASIKWTLEMLRRGEFGKLTAKQDSVMEDIYESNERMISLINDLLNASHIQEGRLKFYPAKIDLLKLWRKIISEKQAYYNAHNLKVELKSIGNNFITTIDHWYIRQVIESLLSNAINYSNKKGEISVLIKKEKCELICSITDSGMGIPKNEQPHIFQKFFRGTNVSHDSASGTGLGLYVSKSIIETTGGKIGFHSQENEGSTFYFSLPIKK